MPQKTEDPAVVENPAPQFAGHRRQWFGHLTYSQHGEDLLFAATFNRLGLHQPSYLDIGAHHPRTISNTALLYSRGSSGINVDANPEYMDAFKRERPRDTNLTLGVAPKRGELKFYRFEGESAGRSSFSEVEIRKLTDLYPSMVPHEEIIKTVTIDDIVQQHAGGIYPDLLCVDIEYFDTAVLQSTDFTPSRPKLICTEVLNQPGEPIPEIYEILESKGFARYARMGSNVIFAEKNILPRIW